MGASLTRLHLRLVARGRVLSQVAGCVAHLACAAAPELWLPRPEHNHSSPTPTATAKGRAAAATKNPPARLQEITFRSIVEDFAATHNLMFLPSGRVHERSRMPLFRVSPTADGKGGVLVYILDDAVWGPDEGGEYRAITLENMVLRATKGSN